MKRYFKYIVLVTFVIFAAQSCEVLNKCNITFTASEGENYFGYYAVSCKDSIGFIDLTDSVNFYKAKGVNLNKRQQAQVDSFCSMWKY